MGLIRTLIEEIKFILLSDRVFLSRVYRQQTGKVLDLDNPKTLNEKIMWLKLNDKNEMYTLFADKYRVRDYVSQKIGPSYLIPLLKVYENPSEITLDSLPEPPFIVKTNHDSSGGVVVRHKRDVDAEHIQREMWRRYKNCQYKKMREWHYKGIEKKVVVERLLLSDGRLPVDYKFNCFNGRVEFIYCSIDREGLNYRKIYSRAWEPMAMTWTRNGDENKKFSGPDIAAPPTLNEMIRVAEDLSQSMPYVRIDLYSVEDSVYFGEITLHHGGGIEVIKPESLDHHYGSMVRLG